MMPRIDIYGDIVKNNDKWVYDLLEIDSVCPREVLSAIDKAAGQRLDVYISSAGGDLNSGTEIYSTLRSYEGEVCIHVVGRACSAASLILCARESDITPSGTVMMHNASVYGVGGDYHDMEHARDVLLKHNEMIAAAYMEKTGKSMDELLKIMDRETYLTANEAVEFGIVDSIAPGQTRLVAAGGMDIPPLLLEKIKNVLKDPRDTGDSLLREKAQAQLNLLKMGGKF